MKRISIPLLLAITLSSVITAAFACDKDTYCRLSCETLKNIVFQFPSGNNLGYCYCGLQHKEYRIVFDTDCNELSKTKYLRDGKMTAVTRV